MFWHTQFILLVLAVAASLIANAAVYATNPLVEEFATIGERDSQAGKYMESSG
eukprot:SAG31_NODE_17795_length_657_cov_1.204301_1_plen_52_part_01